MKRWDFMATIKLEKFIVNLLNHNNFKFEFYCMIIINYIINTTALMYILYTANIEVLMVLLLEF